MVQYYSIGGYMKFIILVVLTGCATTFGILSETNIKEYHSIMKSEYPKISKKHLNTKVYGTIKGSPALKNTQPYKLNYITATSGKCSTFQSSMSGYSIACSFKATYKFDSTSFSSNGSITFQDKAEIPKKLEKAILESMTRYVSKNDPIKGLRSKSYVKQNQTLIRDRKIAIGMDERALYLSWGKPSRTNSSTSQNGITKQLIFSGAYVYIRDGKVSSWQTRS